MEPKQWSGGYQKSGVLRYGDRRLSHSGIFFSRDQIFTSCRRRSLRIRESIQRGSRQHLEKLRIYLPGIWGRGAVQNSGGLANRTGGLGTHVFPRVSGNVFLRWRVSRCVRVRILQNRNDYNGTSSRIRREIRGGGGSVADGWRS